MSAAPTPASLIWATDLDVLPRSHVVEARDGYLVVRSPSNPSHYWGNLLLFAGPPQPGDGERWEHAFAAEFAGDPAVRHRTFGWDRGDGAEGAMATEFTPRGYEVERSVGLIAEPCEIRLPARANREVTVRPLDPEPGGDARAWDEVVELQVAARDAAIGEVEHRAFTRQRLADLCALLADGRGSWYVAELAGRVVGSCGIVVTGDRGRYQTVDTAASHRRRGICSRLLVDAAEHAAGLHGARRLVIVADPAYHALDLYVSLGFRPIERICAVCRRPREDRAALSGSVSPPRG